MHKTILTITAILAEAFLAYEALPAAQYKLGFVAGGVFTAFAAIGIFYIWFLVFATKKRAVKLSALAFALFVLLPVSALSVYTASTLPDKIANQASSESQSSSLKVRQKEADKVYSESMKSYHQSIKNIEQNWLSNEKSRKASLRQINREIKATKKLKQPKIYAGLIKQQSELSKPLIRPENPPKPEREILESSAVVVAQDIESSVLGIVQAFAMALFTPAFLWIASCMPDRKKTKPLVGRLHTKSPSLIGNEQAIKREQIEQLAKTDDEVNLRAFELRQIVANPNGMVPVSAIQAALNLSNRQARKAQKAAIEAGFLVKKPSGYFYSEKRNNVTALKAVAKAG